MAALLSLLLAFVIPAFNNFVLLLIPLLTRLFPRIALARRASPASGEI